MKHRIQTRQQIKWLFVLLSGIVWIALSATSVAQTEPVDEPVPEATVTVQTLTEADVAQEAPPADYVSIHVDGGTIRQVLNAFSMQTQRNVVIGPEVISDGVSIHLNNVRWDEALDVILKPYGFGYRKVGDTVVVSKLEKLADLAAVEPLETRVFTLRFLDAGDVKDIIQGQLSPRGSISITTARGQKGWKFASQGGGSSRSAATALGKLERMVDDDERAKSKTLIITDVPGSLARVGEVLAEVDRMPQQVLVESRFLEVNQNLLKDIGLDISYSDSDGDSIGQTFSAVIPGAFDPLGAIAGSPLDALGFVTLTNLSGAGVNMAIRMLQEDDDTKVLSAPRILTLNNQEATIIVGEKFPIIESDVSGSSGSSTTSTTLDYYENIGIQLNVVPQICADGYINMIVHPSVSSIAGFESGSVGSGLGVTALTQYPRINIREAETQILLKNGETVVIGGLLEERTREGQLKVPFLGDIPFIGRLFRRDTTDNMTIDLLIFLSATVVDDTNYDLILEKEEAPEIVEDEVIVIMEEPVMEEPMMEEIIADEPVIGEEAPAAEEAAAKPTPTATVMEDLAAVVEEPAAVVEEPAVIETPETPAPPAEDEPADKTASVLGAVPVG